MINYRLVRHTLKLDSENNNILQNSYNNNSRDTMVRGYNSSDFPQYFMQTTNTINVFLVTKYYMKYLF
jgi:hypothetical protein